MVFLFRDSTVSSRIVDHKVFGTDLEAAVAKSLVSEAVRVPCVIWKCIDYLVNNNGLTLVDGNYMSSQLAIYYLVSGNSLFN